MADHQIDWAALLRVAETEQAAYATLSQTTSDTFRTAGSVAATGGTLDRILNRMSGAVIEGAPSSNVAREVAQLVGQAKTEQRKATAAALRAQNSLRAANVIALAAAAKVKAAHDTILGT